MSVTINGTTGINKVVPDTVPQSEVVQDIGSLGFRNKIINGNFRVGQRGVSFTAPNEVFTLDRWKANTTGNVEREVYTTSMPFNSITGVIFLGLLPVLT